MSIIAIAEAATLNAQADALISRAVDAFVVPTITLITALAVLYFLYGVFEFIRNSASDEGVDTGRKHIFWGVIGLFIIVSVWGIIAFICNTVGCNSLPFSGSAPNANLPTAPSGQRTCPPGTSPQDAAIIDCEIIF